MRPKALIPTLLFLVASFVAFSQDRNPFQSIGKKGKILTLSNGRYDELFDQDSIQQIGTVLVNIRQMKVVKLLKDEKEAQKLLDNSTNSRFLSVDPLTRNYPELTPYQFGGNSPIVNLDLDGAEDYNVNIALDDKGHYMTNNAPEFRAGLLQKWLGNAFGIDMPKTYYVVALRGGTNVTVENGKSNIIGAWRVGNYDNVLKFIKDENYRNQIMGTPDVVGKETQDREQWLEEYNTNLRAALGAKYALDKKQTKQQTPVDKTQASASINKQVAAANNGKLGGRTIVVDENLSPTIATELKNQGYNVKTFPKGTVDADILTYAEKNNAIVLTNNIKDFNKWGITTMKVSENMKKTSEIGKVVQAIENLNIKSQKDPGVIEKGKNVSLAENK
jgi:hypothetical protein